jgi:hypothetical protein
MTHPLIRILDQLDAVENDERSVLDDDGVTALIELSDQRDTLRQIITSQSALLTALQKARYMVWHEAGDDAAGAPWKALLVEIDAAISQATE